MCMLCTLQVLAKVFSSLNHNMPMYYEKSILFKNVDVAKMLLSHKISIILFAVAGHSSFIYLSQPSFGSLCLFQTFS